MSWQIEYYILLLRYNTQLDKHMEILHFWSCWVGSQAVLQWSNFKFYILPIQAGTKWITTTIESVRSSSVYRVPHIGAHDCIYSNSVVVVILRFCFTAQNLSSESNVSWTRWLKNFQRALVSVKPSVLWAQLLESTFPICNFGQSFEAVESPGHHRAWKHYFLIPWPPS